MRPLTDSEKSLLYILYEYEEIESEKVKQEFRDRSGYAVSTADSAKSELRKRNYADYRKKPTNPGKTVWMITDKGKDIVEGLSM